MSDKRLTAALAKIGLDNDAEALAGARFATKLLKERGLDWPKVAEILLGRTLGDMMAPDGAQHPQPAPPPANDWGSAFADIFAGSPFARKPAQAQPEPRPQPGRTSRTHNFLTGSMIPPYIHGTVRIDDEGVWSGKETLTVTLKSADGGTSYGPMKVFDQAVVAMLREAAHPYEPRIVTMTVRQPRQARHMPVVAQASLDGHARAA